MEFKGINGRVIVQNNNIVILREKTIDLQFHKETFVKLPINEINKVLYSAGGITNGYICFLTKKIKKPQNIIQAMKNENTIIFRMFKNEEAESLVKYVSERIR